MISVHVQKELFYNRLIRGWFSAITMVIAFDLTVLADDWPTYQHDIARSGITGEKLATPLIETWIYRPNHPPAPAWEQPRPTPAEGILESPRVRFDKTLYKAVDNWWEGPTELPRVCFDDVYHIVAVGDALYFGSSADNKVYCLDATSASVRWTFFTGGPVRLAPSIYQNRVYVGSDDGNVYCLSTTDGHVVWQRHVGPSDRRLLGRGKMISMWPLRTSVLVDDGVAYYGAGIFPSEGVYVEAVRADD